MSTTMLDVLWSVLALGVIGGGTLLLSAKPDALLSSPRRSVAGFSCGVPVRWGRVS